MLRFVFVILSLLVFPLAVSAQQVSDGPHEDHGPGVKGKRGGPIQHLGGYEAELVVKGRSIVLYLSDLTTGKRIPVEGITATVFVVQGTNRRATVVLHPKEGVLQASASIPKNADAVINVRLPDGKSSQARFELGTR